MKQKKKNLTTKNIDKILQKKYDDIVVPPNIERLFHIDYVLKKRQEQEQQKNKC